MPKYEKNPEFANSRLDPTSFERNERLVHKLVRQSMKRISSLSYVTMDEEDVRQEILMKLFECQKGFDKDAGVAFTTYFVRSVWNRINKLLERESNSASAHAISEFQSSEGEEDFSLLDYHQSPLTVDDRVELHKDVMDGISRLSREAQTMVSWLVNPPDFVVQELEAYNYKERKNQEITLIFISRIVERIYGLSRVRATEIRKTIEKLVT